MDIRILDANAKKIREEEVGYEVEFLDIYGKESLGYTLEVIYGSHVDTFLKFAPNGFVKLAILDGRIIALANNKDQIELVRDVIAPEFSGREIDGNINYVKENYGVQVDLLEARLEDLIKTSHLKIVPLSIIDGSEAYEDGIDLVIGNESRDKTHIYCPSGSIQSKFILKMAGLEVEDYNAALERLLGKEIYAVLCLRDVIAIVDKETKEICILHTLYGREVEHYNHRNVKMLEEKYGITSNSLDNRIKMLLKNNEESK